MKIQFFRSLYFILKKGHRHNFTYHNSSYVFIFSLAFFFFCSWFSWFWWIQNCLVKLFQLFYLAMKSVHLPGCVVQNDIWHLKIENKNNNKKKIDIFWQKLKIHEYYLNLVSFNFVHGSCFESFVMFPSQMTGRSTKSSNVHIF